MPIETLLAASPAGAGPFLVSYAPSGSMFARLSRPRPGDPGAPRLLALGDPAFPTPEDTGPAPEPPDHGLAIVGVQKLSNADLHGLRAGDVLLEYNGKTIEGIGDLQIVSPDDGARPIPIAFWRNGEVRRQTVATGPLGIRYHSESPAEFLLAQRAATAVLKPLTRGDAWTPLPGTRREVEAIAALFPDGQVTTLLGDRATETALQAMAGSGELAHYRYIHFATHGVADPVIAMNSSLILAPDPDRPAPGAAASGSVLETDGRITAQQIARTWKLDADLVVLSACQTGLGRQAGGEGYLGFSQALFVTGARSVVLSLWKVDDEATALLMTRFYQNLLGRRAGLDGPMPKVEALHEARHWLRTLTAAEADRTLASIGRGEIRHRPRAPVAASEHPYEHPHDWSAFILLGDPN